MNKLIILTVTGLLVSACSTKPITVDRIAFNEVEFTSLAAQGTTSISGTAFIVDAQGEKHFPSNAQARLNPKTSYSRQWYEVNYLNQQNIADADPRYLKYVRKADIDARGNFSFENIPAGNYYISAPVFWMKEFKLEDGSVFLKRMGAFVCYEIQVEQGKDMIVQITTDNPFDVVLSE
ncbi:MAG: hypothetical protein OEY00_01085 [Gammaproteobacteria bacterium]|nr:hypothetical protein [Gammaproteobacteria bacterium]